MTIDRFGFDWHTDRPKGCRCHMEIGVLCNVCDALAERDERPSLADRKAAEIDSIYDSMIEEAAMRRDLWDSYEKRVAQSDNLG